MTTISIDEIQELWQMATRLHAGQKYGGAAPGEQIEYLNHLGMVFFEVANACRLDANLNFGLAARCAILHDSLEDTNLDLSELENRFGVEVAMGVLALTKQKEVGTSRDQMMDSLERIRAQPREIWVVKLADRICNLYAPPFYWTDEKRSHYLLEAALIHEKLKEGSEYMATRLLEKMNAYKVFIRQDF